MSTRAGRLLIAGLLLACSSPGSAQFPDLRSVDRGDPSVRFRLPGELTEVSGLAWHPTGFLLAHDDERGVVYSIRPLDGAVAGSARLRPGDLLGDFEGITVLDERRVLLITSEGRLHSLDLSTGESDSWDTGLDQVCEVEGLATLPGADEVVIACKTLYEGSDREALVLLRTSATDRDAIPAVHLIVSSDALRDADVPRPFLPSGIEVVDDGYLILSARRARLLAVDHEGRIVSVARLDEDRHPQAEGIAVDVDGGLWISDEAAGGRPYLARYPFGGDGS